MGKATKAIFLDRDGTINIDYGYVHQIDQFQFIDGCIESLKELKELGYLLILVTNQSGIARGYFSEAQFLQLTEWMDWSLADRGVDLDGIYYCPHHINGIGEFKVDCNCRKPKTGMFEQAISDFNIDPSISFMVGDKKEDMQAGINAGIKNKVLVRTGKPITEESINFADYVINSISELPNLIRTLNK
ncbi:D-alpha,beta-D-heptose 1,7-bisphosphate phosphatase [Bisgaardia hudsonensis]|uniref:D,D-heptose 1,7-bisphosphate phosphatase n=1 Tax=Bisgaardia hudsonensis TaxID=109472 RepID=A0A4R2MXW8_9PAST|nr:D-glycero-beta-D-manno-heptose 1,7-bisphosphate 7-phosphatase [Bisgaardia hudsonensis]QLB12363.1 D-glycero-beta-D-manno-heptose-1,7-bisphosphate 7-phosphatase [Bisgaardia hudsonensis]TCP12414.1 D-alpha,beta-D-heptose 1,7-bisphosphate phosphatase [Bisgaardia hudsonensis]